MAENLGNATLYLDIDDAPLSDGLANTELLVSQRLQTMAAQVVAQNNLITSSFAAALGDTTTSIDTAFAGWTTTFSTQQSALSAQSSQLFTDFTVQLLTQSTFLTESLIAGGAATDAWTRASALALTAWLESTSTASAAMLTGLYGNFSNWLGSSFRALAASTAMTANQIVATINGLATRMNQPIAAWNALQFSVPGFSHTVRVPTFTLPTGETVGGQSRSFGWEGVNLQTANAPAVPHVAPLPTIVGAAVGGLFMQPTLAAIADGGQPEAVIPLSRLPQFAGEAAAAASGGRTTELHIHIENAYGVDDLVDQINSAWLDGRLRGLQDQLAGAG